MLVGIALWCVASAAAAGLPSPSPSPAATPSPPPWLSPFCPVSAVVIPWDAATDEPAGDAAGTAVALGIFSEKGRVADVHVTLIGDAAAYDAHVSDVELYGRAYDRKSAAMLVTLPSKLAIRYAYVDSYALDGSAQTSCPSAVEAVNVWKAGASGDRPGRPDSRASIAATYLQALPALPCGKVFTPAKVAKAAKDFKGIGYYGAGDRTAEIRIYLDSKGNLLQSYVYKTSGIAGVDSYALLEAQATTYTPATFLCTPVVSDYLFSVKYEGR